MASSNIEIYRAGHEAFNQRDFEAMTNHYADNIAWTDHSQRTALLRAIAGAP
jgi:ketosteroid isomerase-like protein